MTINRQKKNVKQRGSKTCGWGAKKKHRGAGSRGGRGNAGSGKRGDVGKPSFLKQGRVMGRHGFKSPLINPNVNTINLSLITQRLNNFIESKDASKSKDGIELNLTKMGYDKLLGSGNITEKLIISVYVASVRAIEKVEALGGKVILRTPREDEFENSDEEAETGEVVEKPKVVVKKEVVEKPKAKPATKKVAKKAAEVSEE